MGSCFKFHDERSQLHYGASYMDVGCPKCQTEYELDDTRVTEDGITVKCASCGYVFRVKRKQLVVTLPAKGNAPTADLLAPAASPELPPPPPSREWKVRQASGHEMPCADLTILQRGIIEGRIERDDLISLGGENWKRLGDVPELASFFQVMDDASKARSLGAQERETPAATPAPPTPPPPSAPTGPPSAPTPEAPNAIVDTWRDRRFSELSSPSISEPRAPAPPLGKRPTTKHTPQVGRREPTISTLPSALERPLRTEPSDEELRRALKGGGSGKWIFLTFLGLGLGGAAGWYYLVHLPQQQRLAEESWQPRPMPPAPPVEGMDGRVESEEEAVLPPAQQEADAGQTDAGEIADSGLSEPWGVDAGIAVTPPPALPEMRKDFDWYLAQAERLRESDRPEQALVFYAKASELKPGRVEPVTGRGLAQLDMGNPSLAAATFEAALKLNGRYGPAIMGMAEAYRLEGRDEKAIEFYQRYLEVLPHGAEAAVARNSIERLKK